jgi:rubrerythrin
MTPGSAPSRRELFRICGVTATGAGVSLIAGCGGGEDRPPFGGRGGGGGAGDVKLLNAALDLEHTAIAAYTAGAQRLKGTGLAVGRTLLRHEQEHADHLARAIRGLGGTPNRPKPAAEYARSFPRLRSQSDVLRFAVDLENTAVRAYLDAIPRLSSGELRQTAAAILASEAEHIAILLGEANPRDPAAQVSEAFVTGVATS